MKICITGAAGGVAQTFIPLLCNGSIFKDLKIELALLDIPNEIQVNIMKGIQLELQDCNYQNLLSVSTHTNSDEAFKDCDLIVFIGGFPRKPGMQRKDLLSINSKIFKAQALSLKYAKPDVKMLVVANPCNTNAKILHDTIIKNQINVDIKNITSLSRLDQNRAEGIYKFNKKLEDCNIFIWGNHSNNLFVDTLDKSIEPDLTDEFIKQIQNRGAEIIKVKGSSSTFSAANAIKDHLKDWYFGSNGKIVSMGVVSTEVYGVTKGLVFCYPIKCTGNWKYEIVEGIELTEKRKNILKNCNDELNEEASEIQV